MNDDELHDALERIGASNPQAMDPMAEARIERRLRELHEQPVRRPTVIWPVLAGVTAAVLLAVAFVGSTTSPSPVDTTGVAGQVDGQPGATTTRPSTKPDDSPDAPSGDAETPTVDGDDAPFEPTPPASEPDSSGRTDEPEPPRTTVPTTTSSTPPTTTVDSPRPRPAKLRASVTLRAGRAVVEWEDPSREVAVWTVMRFTGGDEGRRVLRSTDVALRRYVEDPPVRDRVAYVVRGHRQDGTVVVESEQMPLVR